MATTKFILIRHGETQWNQQGIYQGQKDSPLTAVGIYQAQALGRRLKNQQIDQLYSSDLGRAYQTATAIAANTGHSIITDTGLRERHYGIFQGQNKTTISTQFPEEYAYYTSDNPQYTIPGGESNQTFSDRVICCLDTLAAQHPDQCLAVVSHGGVLAAIFHYILTIPYTSPRRFTLANTSYNCITRQDTGWQLETLGDISHLDSNNALDDETIR